MTLAFPSPPPLLAAISGRAEFFPVRRIFCVGRNYVAHAREMGADEREPPFFFTKFADAFAPSGSVLPYPPMTADYHHEAELVIAIGAEGEALAPQDALSVVFGYAAGLDMTRRDLQLAARDKGRPWDMGKNFAHSAPLGDIHPVSAVGHLTGGPLRLTVNGLVRQEAELAELIWSCAEIVSHLSAYERLKPGDLIYTGTPAGVGPVASGDVLRLTIANLAPLEVTIGPPQGGMQ